MQRHIKAKTIEPNRAVFASGQRQFLEVQGYKILGNTRVIMRDTKLLEGLCGGQVRIRGGAEGSD